MKKSERIIRNVCICGIVSYLVYCFYLCVKDRVHSAPWDYLGRGYRSEFGVVLILSLLGIIYIAVSNRIRNRKTIGLKPISKAYRISFIVSYIPYVILLAYSLYCSKYGFEFFGKSYGWQGFYDAFIIMGLVFCVIPVFPFCIFWQILYIVKYIRSRKAERR